MWRWRSHFRTLSRHAVPIYVEVSAKLLKKASSTRKRSPQGDVPLNIVGPNALSRPRGVHAHRRSSVHNIRLHAPWRNSMDLDSKTIKTRLLKDLQSANQDIRRRNFIHFTPLYGNYACINCKLEANLDEAIKSRLLKFY